MRILRILGAAAVLVACAAGTSARANEVDVSVQSAKRPGEKPSLVLKVNKDLKSATIDVRSDAGRARQTLGPKDAGGALEFPLPHVKSGKVTWAGTLTVEFADGGQGSMPLKFQTEVLSPFKYAVKELKTDEHTITLVSEHDTAQIDLEVTGEDGVVISTTSQAEDGAKAGTPMTVKWTPLADGPALCVHIVVTDTASGTQSSDACPFLISIPHEEVEFETGKADVRASEEPKLEKARGELEGVLKKYAKAVKMKGVTIKLFVSGHTDTVGSSASNRALSDRRAQAIAQWFSKKGVVVPIYARGFGEDLLKVETPDETDEQKNRRVDYNVGVDGPTGSTAGWTRVR